MVKPSRILVPLDMAETPPFLTALQNPKCYDHPVISFTRVETHISWVILTGFFAYKIKKPVNLGFLDFSTLEKRKFYCEEEVRLNRRLCPDLYLGVVPLTGDPAFPIVGGQGKPFEFMVKMKQFDEYLLWDRMLERGELQPRWLDELALEVAEFHQGAPRASREQPYGLPETFWKGVESTLQHVAGYLHHEGDRDRFRTLTGGLEQSYRTLADRMMERRQEGAVREVHGDLHLRNIALYSKDDPKLLIFDGIEFDDTLRWIDVINEIAFLFMDLEHRHRADLAWRFLNTYLEITGDYKGLDLLRLYAANRALIRAKVLAIHETQGTSQEGREGSPLEFRQFLELAESYLKLQKPCLYMTHGLSGSGKTTETKKLIETLRAVRIRSDIERKRLFGLRPEESSPPALKERMYSPESNLRTYDRLKDLSRRLLKAHYTVIVDAAFLRRQPREEFRQLAFESRADFKILDFRADAEVLKQRVQSRLRQQKDASEADLDVLSDQIRSHEDLTADEKSFEL